MLVRYVVGELELVEGDDLLHPGLPGSRRIRVDVHPLWHFRIGLASHHPTAENLKNINIWIHYVLGGRSSRVV